MANVVELKKDIMSSVQSVRYYNRMLEELYERRDYNFRRLYGDLHDDADMEISASNVIEENVCEVFRFHKRRYKNHMNKFIDHFKFVTYYNPIKKIKKKIYGFDDIFINHILPFLYEIDEQEMKKERRNAMRRLRGIRKRFTYDTTVVEKNLNNCIDIVKKYMKICIYSAVFMDNPDIIQYLPYERYAQE